MSFLTFSNNNGTIQCHARRKSIANQTNGCNCNDDMFIQIKSCWLNRYLTLPQDPDLKGIENVGIDF